MRMYDIIMKKKNGGALSRDEILFFVEGFTAGVIPDYQASALLMAICFAGMTDEETLALTLAIADSGNKMDLSAVSGFKVDKHSSGGVGDKTTLVVAPIVASCGAKVAKMSGRGLGHTGGTIDKLEAIPGYKTMLPKEQFVDIVNRVGVSVVGQSGELAPADKKLYALRDVTATVDSVPLIASSIMGKKLASANDGIVLDIKVGSGSFNKTPGRAKALAEVMVNIGNRAGKKTVAVLTDMNRPLGKTVGNALEVIEAIRTMKNEGDSRFTQLCLTLAAKMLEIAGFGSSKDCYALAQEALTSGRALVKFREMVQAHGGDVRYIDDEAMFDVGKTHTVNAERDGFITSIDTEAYGVASLLLGAGRSTKDAAIDMCAGIEVIKNLGDKVKKGEPVAVLHAKDSSNFSSAESKLLESLTVSQAPPESAEIILGVIE